MIIQTSFFRFVINAKEHLRKKQEKQRTLTRTTTRKQQKKNSKLNSIDLIPYYNIRKKRYFCLFLHEFFDYLYLYIY